MGQYLSAAELVVEGQVSKETFAVRNAESGFIETVHTIHIDRILKGKPTLTTVEVHTPGGELDGVFESVSHGSRLIGGQRGIFLLSPKPNSGYYLHGGNAGKITRLKYDDDYEAIHWGELDKYTSWRQLREQVGAALGVDLMIHPLTSAELEALTNDKEFCVKLDNPVPNVEDMTVEFDVMAKSSVPGLKFGSADVIITYPTENLGDFVVDQEKIEAGKGDITDGPAYTIAVEDKSEDQIELSIESPCDNSEPHYVLDTVYEKLATLTVEVNEWGDFGTMNVDDFSVDGTAEYVNPATFQGTPGCTEFDDLCGEGSFPLMACSITSIGSQPIAAGIGQIVTISGSNFGNGVLGEIILNDADDGGSSKLEVGGLDFEVISSWSPTEIKFRIESRYSNTMTGSGSGPFHPFGSGELIVDPAINSQDPNTLRCITTIDIDYALYNDFDEESEIDKTLGLALNKLTYPDISIHFYLDTDIASSSTLQQQGVSFSVVESILLDVLCEWENSANINLTYKGGWSGVQPSDGTFVTFVNLATPGETVFSTTGNLCSGDIQYIDTYSRAEVRFDEQLSFGRKWYTGSSSSVPDTMIDLFSILLHEVGHSLGFTHNMDTDLNNDPFDSRSMFWRIGPGLDRRTVDSKTASGLVFNSNESRAASIPGRCFAGRALEADSGTCPSTSSPTSEIDSEEKRLGFYSKERNQFIFDEGFVQSKGVVAVTMITGQILSTLDAVPNTIDLSLYPLGSYVVSFTTQDRQYSEIVIR